MDTELTIHDCCPECCGGLVQTKPEAGDEGPLRCNSCGIIFKPVKPDDSN